MLKLDQSLFEVVSFFAGGFHFFLQLLECGLVLLVLAFHGLAARVGVAERSLSAALLAASSRWHGFDLFFLHSIDLMVVEGLFSIW